VLSKRVLVVDDDRDMAAATAHVLEAAGYEVALAHNGQHGLGLLLLDPEPGVVLLDLEMPVMSGRKLVSVMRAHKRLSRIPVVAMTEDATPGDEPFDGALRKPLAPLKLLATVARVVAKRRARS
jgi:CheY-like chemotaxis protein